MIAVKERGILMDNNGYNNQMPPVGPPPMAPPPIAPPPVDNNARGMAIASLVCGICSIPVYWFIYGYLGLALAVVGLVFGAIARKKLTPENGRGMATAGMVISIVCLAIVVALIMIVCCAAAAFLSYY